MIRDSGGEALPFELFFFYLSQSLFGYEVVDGRADAGESCRVEGDSHLLKVLLGSVLLEDLTGLFSRAARRSICVSLYSPV